jgi:glycosyltransferase involved in cell wall biosynthesis
MSETRPKLSVVMPAYNEEGNLEKAVSDACAVLDEVASAYEILIVNDGSTDRTAEIADRLAAENGAVQVLHHPENRGYGDAQKTGFAAASYEWVTLVPSDNQFPMEDIRKYLHLMETTDVIVGYRIKRVDSFIRRTNARLYGGAIRVLFNTSIIYGDIDWVKFYRKEVLDAIEVESSSAFVDAELVIKADKRGYRIEEIGVGHLPRMSGKETGGDLKVIVRGVSDLFKFWVKGLFNPKARR